MENTKTENKLIKMPSIPQYRNIVKDIKTQATYIGRDEDGNAMFDETIKAPTLTLHGTIKLHGTNAAVCYDGETLWTQSKANIITPLKDNAGFASFVQKNKDYFTEYLSAHFKTNPELSVVCIYGEWAGKGIQKGVGISELPKTFYTFGIKYKTKDSEEFKWSEAPEVILKSMSNKEKYIDTVFNYKTYTLEINFETPSLYTNKLIELTDEIDKECPVAKAQGIEGHGEGIVWVTHFKETRFQFKSKGESHSKSKVKTLSPVDDAKEKVKIEFANYATPAWRLEQMFNETFDILNGGTADIKGTGAFIKAVVSDVMKEELDELVSRGLEPKEVNGYISKIARIWFMEQLDKDIMKD